MKTNEEVAKRMVFLAYQNGEVLAAEEQKAGVTEDDVWQASETGPNFVNCGEVLGKKVQISLRWNDKGIYRSGTAQDVPWLGASAYAHFDALIEDAIGTLEEGAK